MLVLKTLLQMYVSALCEQAQGENGSTCEPHQALSMEHKVEKTAQAGDGQPLSPCG